MADEETLTDAEALTDDTDALTDDAKALVDDAVAEVEAEGTTSTFSASKDDQSSLFSGIAAALMVSEQERAFSRYRTSLAVMTSLPLIQMLKPPSLTPGVLSQMSCRIVVQSPKANVQAPRPMERPYSESHMDFGGVEQSEGVCLSFGTYCC